MPQHSSWKAEHCSAFWCDSPLALAAAFATWMLTFPGFKASVTSIDRLLTKLQSGWLLSKIMIAITLEPVAIETDHLLGGGLRERGGPARPWRGHVGLFSRPWGLSPPLLRCPSSSSPWKPGEGTRQHPRPVPGRPQHSERVWGGSPAPAPSRERCPLNRLQINPGLNYFLK